MWNIYSGNQRTSMKNDSENSVKNITNMHKLNIYEHNNINMCGTSLILSQAIGENCFVGRPGAWNPG